MSEAIDKLTTEELQAELERRRFERMSKEELIKELEKAKQGGDWPEKTRRNVLELAATSGVDVNEYLKVSKVGFNAGVGILYVIAALFVLVGLYSLLTGLPGTVHGVRQGWRWLNLIGSIVMWAMAYIPFWFANKTSRIYRGVYDGRNQSTKD